MDSGEKASAGEDVPLVNVEAAKIATTTVAVEGMTCGACTATIEGRFPGAFMEGARADGEGTGEFKGVDGVKSFTISLMTERAVVEHDTAVLLAEEIVDMCVSALRGDGGADEKQDR